MTGMIKQMQNIAALSAAKNADPSSEEMIEISKIVFDPEQPRQTFYQVDDVVSVESQESLQALAETMKSEGLLQPIVVEVTDDGNYRLVAGERRTRAAKILGWSEIRATVRHNLNIVQRRAIQIIENVQREDLSEMDIAVFIRRCVDDGMTQKDVAKSFNKPASWVNNYMKWLDPVLHNRWVSSGLVKKAYILAEVARLSEDDQKALYEIVTKRGTPLTQSDSGMIRRFAQERRLAESQRMIVAESTDGKAEPPASDASLREAGLRMALADMGIQMETSAASAVPPQTLATPVWPDATPGMTKNEPGNDAPAVPPTYTAGGAITSAEHRDAMSGQTTTIEAMSQAVRSNFLETVTVRMTVRQLHALTNLANIPADMEGAVQMMLPAGLVDDLLRQMGESPEGGPAISRGQRLLAQINKLAK